LMRVLRHDGVAYLRRRHLLLLLEPQREQCFPDADIAVRRMIVFIATVKTFVPEALIAVAVTRQLRERNGNLSRRTVSIARYTAELRRIECRSKTRLSWRHFEVRRNSLSRGNRGVLVLWCRPSRRGGCDWSRRGLLVCRIHHQNCSEKQQHYTANQ